MILPSPHGDKLHALRENAKLPDADRDRVDDAIKAYEDWIAELAGAQDADGDLVRPLVDALDRYKTKVDIDLIFDSPEDFLYRQKGQLKLDNTVVEEFLPWLIARVFGDRLTDRSLLLGPINAFSHLRFESGAQDAPLGTGMVIRSKDHDFALGRPLYLKSSHSPDYGQSTEIRTALAYLAAEIKTNLDKTMFQEASATARDLKLALPNSRYFLLCEWLDMTPINTFATAVEEVIVLRKARRLSADARRGFATARGRSAGREMLIEHLARHPMAAGSFRRFLSHAHRMLEDRDSNERDVLDRGWF